MNDPWLVGPTALAVYLRRRGYSTSEAEELVALRMRYLRGGFREWTDQMKRLVFARWLVDHGWLSEFVDDD